MKKLILLNILCFIDTTLSAQSNLIQVDTSVNKELSNIHLAPVHQQDIDFDLIISKNKEKNIDIYDVYAWSKIYEGTSRISSSLVNYISNKLTAKELKEANENYIKLSKDLKNNNQKIEYLYPNKLLYREDVTKYEITPIKTIAPKYPRRAFNSKTQGTVHLMFNIYQDGSVRDIYVSSEYPKDIFTKVSIHAISKYRFKIKSKNNTEMVDFQASTQSIEFKLQGNYPLVPLEKIKYINEQFALAKNEEINAQHEFTNAFKNIPFDYNKKIVNLEQINDWLFHLANEGFADSQYYLGHAIFVGEGCLTERQKGFEWMIMSAKQGYSDAQFTLYNWIDTYGINNTSGYSATYWLEVAAKNGSIIAQLEFAKKVAYSDVEEGVKITKAEDYIENYANRYGELPQYFQIKALLLSKQAKKSKARASIKKAIKLARKAGWDLSELKQQQTMIENHNIK